MKDEKPYLTDDPKHLRECHNRWSELLNRDTSADDYQPEWGVEQCGGCRFFIPLTGVFADDWGGCTNALLPFDKRIMFEHDGCVEFEAASNGWFAGTYYGD